ncbi:MAG: hypothetical protein OCD02_21810 [Spirochaetaceae bacterium]
MSIQEKKIIVNIVGTIAIYTAYCMYVKGFFLNGMEHDLQLWGKTILIFIPIAIGVKILTLIIFFIINAIVTNGEEIEDIEDERDKLISSKGNNIGYIIVGAGFLFSIVSLVIAWPIYIMINIMYLFFNLADISSDITKIVLYRKGV